MCTGISNQSHAKFVKLKINLPKIYRILIPTCGCLGKGRSNGFEASYSLWARLSSPNMGRLVVYLNPVVQEYILHSTYFILKVMLS